MCCASALFKLDFMHKLIALFVLSLPLLLNAASFDCAKAASLAEMMICNDPELSKLDDELGLVYAQAKSTATDQKGFSRATVNAWKWREANCHTKECLTQWYKERSAFLNGTDRPLPSATQAQLSATPNAATNLDPLELGQLILLLIPEQNSKQTVEWDYKLEDARLNWLTSGVKQENGHHFRKALVRVHVNGKKLTTLKQRLVEVAWLVTLKADAPGLRPTQISIKQEECDGPWCNEIEPLPSLLGVGIKAAEICKFSLFGDRTTVWRLTGTNKRATFLVSEVFGGSKVQEAQLFLELEFDAKQLCEQQQQHVMGAAKMPTQLSLNKSTSETESATPVLAKSVAKDWLTKLTPSTSDAQTLIAVNVGFLIFVFLAFYAINSKTKKVLEPSQIPVIDALSNSAPKEVFSKAESLSQEPITYRQMVDFNVKQLIGMAGSVLLLFGAFAPLVSVPILGTISYVQNGKGDGMIVASLAAVGFLAAVFRWNKGLWITGLGSLSALVFTFINFQIKMAEVKEKMESELAGNPFKGLADMAMQSIQFQWGWAILIIGIGLVLVSAAMKEH